MKDIPDKEQLDEIKLGLEITASKLNETLVRAGETNYATLKAVVTECLAFNEVLTQVLNTHLENFKHIETLDGKSRLNNPTKSIN